MHLSPSIMHGDPVAPVILGVTSISAIVLTVVVTTLIAPSWLKAAIGRQIDKESIRA